MVLDHSPVGTLAVGIFDSDDDVASVDHKVITAYRWPIDTFSEHLAGAGFVEVQRLQHQSPENPGRMYATIAARAL